MIINETESIELMYLNDYKAIIEYSNAMGDNDTNIEEYNLNKKSQISIAFDYTITDMLSNKHLLE